MVSAFRSFPLVKAYDVHREDQDGSHFIIIGTQFGNELGFLHVFVPLKEVPLKEVSLKEVSLKEVSLKEVSLMEVPWALETAEDGGRRGNAQGSSLGYGDSLITAGALQGLIQ